MPVRSSSSSVLAWPKKNAVEKALVDWAAELCTRWTQLLGVGYFGSYSRGDWGVGSDLDVLLVTDASEVPFERRAAVLDTAALPVPVDALVYTRAEMQDMARQEGRFSRTLRRELRWAWRREGFDGLPASPS